jgi:hypothetical protein
MALSDDLTGLAARVKEAEDHVAAARAKTQAEVEQDIAAVRASAEARADRLRKDAEERKSKLSVWWHDLERSWNEHLAKIRDDIDAKRSGHDVDRAERRAERAEGDAEFAISFAYAAVEEAEYAVLDATLARMEADDRRKQSATA